MSVDTLTNKIGSILEDIGLRIRRMGHSLKY